MNEWLQRQHNNLESQLAGLNRPHASGRSNVHIRAEIQGKFEACTLLKDSDVRETLIKNTRRKLMKEPLSKVDRASIEFYRRGANEFLDECSEQLLAKE